jgi:hypothetical protein
MPINLCAIFFSVLAISFSVEATEFNRSKIAEWPDPVSVQQKRTHCISDHSAQFWQDKKQTCRSWATDSRTRQIAVYAKTLVAEHFPRPAFLQAQTTADKCASEAIMSAQQLFSKQPVNQASNNIVQVYSDTSAVFKRCINAEINDKNEHGIKASFFKLAFDVETYWSKWSNE